MERLKNIDQLTARVVTQKDTEYKESRIMWNRGIEKYPLAIAYCQTQQDVSNSVIWAKEQGIPIRIRSGGHHYDGYSTGDDVFVIDVSEMKGISVDEQAETVTIEAGVRNRELYEALGSKGYPFPGGGCPTVGVVGFALGGGWGYSGRMLGLACDSIVEVQLIDYKGNLLIANEKENKELFWALKGSGGGQFGVVVNICFRLPKQRQEATLIRLEYSEISREDQIRMFRLWQETIEGLCYEANFKLSFYHSKEKGKGILLLGVYYGGEEQAQNLIAPFIRLGDKVNVLVEPMTVLDVNRWIQDAHPDFEHYKSSGRFVKETFDEKAMNTLLDCIDKTAKGAVYTAVSCYGMGGKMREHNPDTAAFAYRDSLYIVGFQTVWEDNQYSCENKTWFVERFRKIEKLTAGSFVNFPAGEIVDYKKAYYGENSFRLQEIKRRYDPMGVFDFEQSL